VGTELQLRTDNVSNEVKTAGAPLRHSISVSPRLRVSLLLLATLSLFLATGCRVDMQDQPKVKPYRGARFYGDGLGMRQPIEGTVARGFLRADTEFYTGKKRTAAGGTAQAQPAAATAGQNATGAAAYPDDVGTLPFLVDDKVLQRGKERYEIFCSACHGYTGYGDGMIVRRNFRRAASFHDDRLRQAPVGHYFDAITNGWGVMPSYAPQIEPRDRWAIVAYIRALQVSQEGRQNPTAAPAASPAASPAAHATPTSGGHQ
jgi:mono/diheme cytochrome c family protein